MLLFLVDAPVIHDNPSTSSARGHGFPRFLTFFSTLTNFRDQMVASPTVQMVVSFREYYWGSLPFFTDLGTDILIKNFASEWFDSWSRITLIHSVLCVILRIFGAK